MLYYVYTDNNGCHKILVQIGGDRMPEKIVSLIDKIAAVKGQDYAKGLVDMANLLAPDEEQEDKQEEK